MPSFQRQAARSSFAFAPAQPVETRNTLDPGFRGGAVEGGNSVGGVVRATPVTLPDDHEIPEFLQRAIEPYIREKQAEAVVKGATDHAAGKTIKDIAKGDSGIGRIFGPSGYHQGAAAFAAMGTWAKAKTDIASDPAVEQMDPGQLGKYLAEKYRSLQTGDEVTDSVLNHTIMQDHGPMVTALTAKHEAWVQRTALNNATNERDSNATSLQASLASGDLDPSSPSGAEAARTMVGNFVASFTTKPYGMTDEAFQGMSYNSARAMVSKGNFYAFEAIKPKLVNIMDDKQAASLDTAYQTAAHRAFQAVADEPAVTQALTTLNMQIKSGLKDGTKNIPMSHADIDEAIDKINETAARRTGIQGLKMIDGDQRLAYHTQFNTGVFEAALRVQTRQWQLEDRAADHEWSEGQKERDRARDLAMANQLASAGNLNGGVKTGAVGENDANFIMGQAVAKGDMPKLARNFQDGSGYVNSYAAQMLQAPVKDAVGIGQVTKGFTSMYGNWQKLYAMNPAAAAAHMGSYAPNMERYDNLLKGGETELAAFALAFGTQPDPGPSIMPTGTQRKDAEAAIRSVVTADDRRWFGFLGTRTPLSTSGQQMLTDWLLPKAADYARTGGVSMDKAASQVLHTALSSGEIERAGPLVWTNHHAAKKLGAFLGLPDDKTDALVTRVIGERLVKAGFSDGLDGDDYRTMRVQTPDGQPALYIMAFPDDGGPHKDVTVTLRDLLAERRKDVAAAQKAASPDSYYHQLMRAPGNQLGGGPF